MCGSSGGGCGGGCGVPAGGRSVLGKGERCMWEGGLERYTVLGIGMEEIQKVCTESL